MQPDFATPLLNGLLYGVVKLLPALLIVAVIMLAFDSSRDDARSRADGHRVSPARSS